MIQKKMLFFVTVLFLSLILFIRGESNLSASLNSIEGQSERIPTFPPTSRLESANANIFPSVDPVIITWAMDINASELIFAHLNGSDAAGTGIVQEPLGSYFPVTGNSFAILSTGLVSSASLPNDEGSLSFILDGQNNIQGNDIVQLALRLRVPETANCASIDFAFYSEEFPEFVGSQFNDTFTIEIGDSNFTIVGQEVLAPNNFAFDDAGNIVSVNTVFGVQPDTGTTYDGDTPLLTAKTPVVPGDLVDVTFTIMDLGDSIYDSTAFIDNFSWVDDPICDPGSDEAFYSVSGTVTNPKGEPVANVELNAQDDLGNIYTATTDNNGKYQFNKLLEGDYTFKPKKSGHEFSPQTTDLTLTADKDDLDFKLKTPLILVHGWRGGAFGKASLECDDSVFAGDQKLYVFDYINQNNGPIPPEDIIEYWQMNGEESIVEWLEADYDVWIAQLDSGPLSTAKIQSNATCLKNQINHVYEKVGEQQITLIAHSMGGLVSRSCLALHLSCLDKVDTLATLGSPHAGIPAGTIAAVLDITCDSDPASCQMSQEYMNTVFNLLTPNMPFVDYLFLTGSAEFSWSDPGFASYLATFLATGPNDGLVDKYSGVGWRNIPFFPDPPHFEPFDWTILSPAEQVWTDEVHGGTYSRDDNDMLVKNDYFNFRAEAPDKEQRSYAYACLIDWLKASNKKASFVNCPKANPFSNNVAMNMVTDSSATNYEFTERVAGEIGNLETISFTLPVDTSTLSVFSTKWLTGTLNVTLTDPNSVVIDPAYAAANPSEVVYDASTNGNVSYIFQTTFPGEWTITIEASDDLGTNDVPYQTVAMVESMRTFDVMADNTLYSVGDTATVTATLKNSDVPIGGATVNLEVPQPSDPPTIVTLTDQGNGEYLGTYTITNDPGLVNVKVVATGNDNGVLFSRQEDLIWTIAIDSVNATGNYSDSPQDDDANGLYEKLGITVEFNVLEAGSFLISADLVSNGEIVAHASTPTELTVGVSNTLLEFDGKHILASQLDGPYTVSNLAVVSLEGTGVSPIQSNVYVTNEYTYGQFGIDHAAYIPISTSNYSPTPDLIVESISATEDNIQVTIKNQGDGPVMSTTEFWVDVYIDPIVPPTGADQLWDVLCNEGLVFGVTSSALPLMPGETLTLTVGDAYYWPSLSNFSGSLAAGTPIYAQVDSANASSVDGNVAENHEVYGGAYNNITGPVLSTTSKSN